MQLTRHSNISNSKAGFTVVEIAIVIVIIGLLIAGVVGGQSLIQSAKQNALISDIKKYAAIINTFKLNYDALPGDMKNATDYWGEDGDGCPAGADNDGTCDGDGNGIIFNRELQRVWEHLSYSELLSNKFNFDDSYTTGVSFPEVEYGGANLGFGSVSEYWGDPLVQRLFKNNLAFCVQEDDFCDSSNQQGVPGEDSQIIDFKIDDGAPNSGKVLASGNSTCTSNGDSFEEYNDSGNSNFTYVITDDSRCVLAFIQDNL